MTNRERDDGRFNCFYCENVATKCVFACASCQDAVGEVVDQLTSRDAEILRLKEALEHAAKTVAKYHGARCANDDKACEAANEVRMLALSADGQLQIDARDAELALLRRVEEAARPFAVGFSGMELRSALVALGLWRARR